MTKRSAGLRSHSTMAARAVTRSCSFGLCFALLAIPGCAQSHGRDGDAGRFGDASCGSAPFLICVSDCRSDAGVFPICTGGSWACPPGTRDLSTCPPTCLGAPPPGCTCVGTDWVCGDGRCPPGLGPTTPDDPRLICATEGAHCSSGGTDACESGMSCDCRGGRWDCFFFERDPVCWCARQPSEGDRCAEDGASCGECCPTPGGTGWPAMQCADGHWTAAACPDIECPVDVVCPADSESLLGTSCSGATICGNPCCGTAVSCRDGVWVEGPDAACACDDTFECGPGTCRPGQYCNSACGPSDGIEFTCPELDEGCTDCSCIPLWATQSCEMIGGRPYVRDVGFCG